jgi:hypothetical protein
VRNAIMMKANPNLLADGSGPCDRGSGHVDAAEALAFLNSGNAPDSPGAIGGNNVEVKVNISQGAGVKTYEGNVTRTATGLKPGQRFETYYRIHPNTFAVIITLSNVQVGSVQNQLFGDDILLAIHSAKTSSIGEGDYKVLGYSTGGRFVLLNPECGLMRVTLNGDWTNAGEVAATVNIISVTDPIPGFTTQAKIADGQLVAVPFTVPNGTATLTARLSFTGDWGSYPANDIDLLLVDPSGGVVLDGATLNVPEFAKVSDPAPGQWLAFVDGFSVFTKGGDKFELRLEADGKVLR